MERKPRPDPLCLLVCEAVSHEQSRQARRAEPLLPGSLVARCASPHLPTGHIPSYRDHWRMLGETCSLAFQGCGGRKSESHLTYTNMLNLPWNKWNHPSTLKVTVFKSPRLNRTRNYSTSAQDFFHKAVITPERQLFLSWARDFLPRGNWMCSLSVASCHSRQDRCPAPVVQGHLLIPSSLTRTSLSTSGLRTISSVSQKQSIQMFYLKVLLLPA